MSGESNSAIPDFEEGQIWEYKTRDEDKESTVRILKIEPNPADEQVKMGRIVHISIKNISLKMPGVGKIKTEIGHMPVFEKNLRESVTRFVGKTVEEPNLEGYNEWKNAKGGVFSIPLNDCIGHTTGSI